MAVERALAKQKIQQAPKDAFCYICLEGDGESSSSKLMRGCGCRGDSAGWVHLKCLTEFAESKDASVDIQAVADTSIKCANCKQPFTGALGLQMFRRYWRRCRSSPDLELRRSAMRCLASCMAIHGERDAAASLFDASSKCCTGDDPGALLDEQRNRAAMLLQNGQYLEAVELLTPLLPEAKADGTKLYIGMMTIMISALSDLRRDQEADDAIREIVAFTKSNCDPDDGHSSLAMGVCATHCATRGRTEESKAMYEEMLTKQTRIFGPDHPITQQTRLAMRYFGFLAASPP